VTRPSLALLIGLGAMTFVSIPIVVGFAWGFWRGISQRPREVVIKYVERVAPATSTKPARPRTEPPVR